MAAADTMLVRARERVNWVNFILAFIQTKIGQKSDVGEEILDS
jgi:hypothetical protein